MTARTSARAIGYHGLVQNPKQIHAVCVHGIGHATPADFADKAMKRLSASLSKKGIVLYSRSVWWGPLLDGPEERAYKELQRRGMEGRMIQGVAWQTLADALAYKNYAENINLLFDYEITKLRAPEHVVFIGHSLGCTLISDYLNSRARIKARALTMGNNQGLWFIGKEDQYKAPAQLKGTDRWYNVFDEDDAIGGPVGHWTPAQDIQVSVGGLFSGWWGASHTAYWPSRRLFSDVVPGLVEGWAI